MAIKDDVFTYAHQYRKLGFSVIPVKKDKKPLIDSWLPYQNKIPTESEINEWFKRKWPSANIGIITGAISKIVVVDIDKKGGEDGEQSLRELLGEIPKTPLSKTPSGGLHLFFKHPDNGIHLNNFARKLPGLDFRGDGGYVVAPPSVGNNGAKYGWVNSIFNTPLPPLPDKLLELITTETKPSVISSDIAGGKNWVTEALAGVSKGRRNDTAARLAGYFLRRLTPQVTLEILQNWNFKNKPPLPKHELATIVSSVKSYHPESQNHWATFDQILHEGFIETPYYIEPKLLGPTDILILGGDPGIGKTLAVSHKACCLTSGEFYHRLKIPNPVTTYLLQLELSYERWKERHWNLLQTFKGKMRKELIVEKQPEKVPLSRLFDRVRDIGAGVIIIDPWTDYWGQETKDQAKAMEQLKNFCRDEGVAAILTHHRKKAGYQELREHRGADSLYGSGALRRFASTIILMNMIDEEDGLTTVLEFDKTRNTNRFQPILEPRWLKLDTETMMFKEQDVDVGAKIRLVIGNSVDGILSFSEIRKALGCHQMIVTRWLKREIKQGRIQKVRGGYRNAIKGV